MQRAAYMSFYMLKKSIQWTALHFKNAPTNGAYESNQAQTCRIANTTQN